MPRQRGNGSGNVTRIKGEKKNPYRVRVTVGYEYDEQKALTVYGMRDACPQPHMLIALTQIPLPVLILVLA